MKYAFLVLATAGLLSCDFATRETGEAQSFKSIGNSYPTEFDSLYANRLGADDYGMHKYVLVLLRKGPHRDQDSIEAARLQRAHLDNMNKWAEDSLLVVAGPTYNHDSDLQGLYVFALENVEEVKALAADDPAIQAGRLVMESYPWYSSAALMDVNRIHNIISKNKI